MKEIRNERVLPGSVVAHRHQGPRPVRDPAGVDHLQRLVRAASRRQDAAPSRTDHERTLRFGPGARRRHEAARQGGFPAEAHRQVGVQPGPDPHRHGGLHHLDGDPVRRSGGDLRGPHPPPGHRPAGGGAVRAGHRIHRHLRHRAGGVGVELHLRLPGGDAQLRADDLLRDRDGAVHRRGVPAGGHHVHLRHRRGAAHADHLPAAVRGGRGEHRDDGLVRAAAGAVVRDLRHRDGG